MSVQSRTTARCLGLVSTAFIAPDGGHPNIAAKTLATLWYILIVPDAQSRLHRHLHHKRVPWYAPSRVLGIALAAANIVTIPLSWTLLFAGKRNASRLAALAVLFNPPSIQLSTLLVTELSAALVKRSLHIARGAKNIAIKPFQGKGDADEGDGATSPAEGASSVKPSAAASAAPVADTTKTAATSQPDAGSTTPSASKPQ